MMDMPNTSPTIMMQHVMEIVKPMSRIDWWPIIAPNIYPKLKTVLLNKNKSISATSNPVFWIALWLYR